MKKFVLSGAPCGGKTTTVLTVGAKFKASGMSNIDILHEVARNRPHPINKGATFQTALWILTEQMREEAKHEAKGWEYLLCDRCVYDELPFFLASVAGPEPFTDLEAMQIEFIRETAQAWAEMYPYELIFLLRPLPLLLDPDRKTTPSYQKVIDEIFVNQFRALPNVIEVSQETREERTKFILDKIIENMETDK